MSYKKPEPLMFTGNLEENWRVFRESYDIYMKAAGLAKTTNETQVAILLNFVGKEGLSRYNTFVFETLEDSKKIDSVLKAFEAYCKPKRNILHARHVFYKRYQKDNESIEEFFSACKTLIKDCEFGSEDEILRDKVVLDTTDADTRNRLIKKGDITLDEAVEALRIAEVQYRNLTHTKVKSKKNKSKKKKGAEQQKNVSNDSNDSSVLNAAPNKVVINSDENNTDSITKMITPKLPSYIENLPYTEDQWSATNTSGNRVYSRAFMLQLSSEIVCQKKLDILKSWSHITRSVNPSQYNSIELGGGMPVVVSQSASATGFMPAYGAYLKSGDRQCGMPVMPCAKNNCSHGKTANKTAKPNTIHMSLSLREEVKLNQTENAWVPTAIKKTTKIDASKNKNEVDLITEEVNKKVSSILNKITLENKESLTEMFKELSIDSYERLEKTIDLVFEKAIEEQNFARLCHAMQGVQVNTDGKTTSFKKRIISKCQSLFELDKAQEMDSAKKLAEINSCKDPDKKKELQTEFEENERRLRKRSVGNCRFIGELFKQKMLTPNIMLYCINNLVTKHNEEPLECLCNLLKTVGKELEQTYNLNETFDKLKGFTSKQFKSKISSRIQFMIQDVIDLREDKWITRHLENKPKLINEEFVKNMLISSLEMSPKCQTETGKMFAELLSKNVLSIVALTEGIDAVLKDWNDYLMDYPQFFSYIAAITAPLLISKTASFDFFNLRDACKSICPDNSSKYFIEILQKILSSKETQDIKEQGGILWIYNKWRKSEKISIDVFVPNNKLNEHFKEDRVGVFLLSIAMYDKMKLTDSKLLYDIMHQWITDNIDEKIIECPQFVRALTIANVIACLKPNLSFDEFFDHVYVKLLTCYIRSKPLPVPEIQAREVQCLYGIQIMSAALEHPGGMVLKLFHKLYQDSVISKESFELWKNDDVFKPGFDEDLETKTMAVVVLNSFFLSLSTNDSDEEETIDP